MQRDSVVTALFKRLARGAAIYALQHPRVLRALAAFLRLTGIWTQWTIVRYQDVVGVLQREQDFTSAEGYAPDILTGPFLLGLDNAPLYQMDKALLHQVVRRSDLEGTGSVAERLHAYLAELTQRLGERFDVVDDVAVKAATFVITDYFGVPYTPELKMWLRRLAAFIVIGQMADEETCRLAEEAADGVRGHVQKAVAARGKAGTAARDDVLGRLLAATDGAKRPQDEAMVVRNLSGLLWVSHAVIVQGITLAIDELLRHPEALQEAGRAAKVGDIDAVMGYTFEALRFNPVFPMLPRYCPRNTVVLDRSGKTRPVAANSKLMVWAIGAMFDPARFEQATAFRADRNLRDYLVFGHGVHQCFGEHMAYVELPQMMLAMLRLNQLQRTAGGPGGILYEGPAVAHLYLEHVPAPSTDKGAAA